MLYIAICDDEPFHVNTMTALVRGWAETRRLSVQIDTYPSAEALLFAETHHDIMLLDVQMGGMDGVTLARQIRQNDRAAQIIFITGYMEYIADGYEVEALHYLIKPVCADKLNGVLDRAAEKLARNERVLTITSGGETVCIPLYEIRYIEVLHNHATIHASRDYMVKRPLTELERELDDGFFRVGRSHIVALRYIARSTKSEVWLTDGSAVPLSRGMYTRLNRALIERL